MKIDTPYVLNKEDKATIIAVSDGVLVFNGSEFLYASSETARKILDGIPLDVAIMGAESPEFLKTYREQILISEYLLPEEAQNERLAQYDRWFGRS